MDAAHSAAPASPQLSPGATSPLLAGGLPSPTAVSPLVASRSGNRAASSARPPIPAAAVDGRSSAEHRPSTSTSHDALSSVTATDSSDLAYNSPSPEPFLSRQSPDPAASAPSTLRSHLRPQPTPEAGSSSTRRHSQNSTFMLAQHRLSRASSIGADSRYPVPLSPSYEFGMMMGGSGGTASTRNSAYVTANSRNSFYAAGSSSRPQSMAGPSTRRDSSYSGYFPPPAQPGTSSQPHAVAVSSPLAGEARNSLRHSVAYPLSSSPTPPDTPRAGGERFNTDSPLPTTPKELLEGTSPLSPPAPFYAHVESGSESSSPTLVFMPYTDEAEPDDELHSPDKLDKKGRLPGNPLKWSSRGFCNIFTVLIATFGLLTLFVVYPITNQIGYNARIQSMEGLGLSIGNNSPRFNASGQLDLSGTKGGGETVNGATPIDPNAAQPDPATVVTDTGTSTGTETSTSTGAATETGTGTGTGTETGTGTDTGAGTVNPTTGRQIDPVTGLDIDPATGRLIDPDTGFPIDPATGEPVDPATGVAVTPGTVPRLRFLRLAR